MFRVVIDRKTNTCNKVLSYHSVTDFLIKVVILDVWTCQYLISVHVNPSLVWACFAFNLDLTSFYLVLCMRVAYITIYQFI